MYFVNISYRKLWGDKKGRELCADYYAMGMRWVGTFELGGSRIGALEGGNKKVNAHRVVSTFRFYLCASTYYRKYALHRDVCFAITALWCLFIILLPTFLARTSLVLHICSHWISFPDSFWFISLGCCGGSLVDTTNMTEFNVQHLTLKDLQIVHQACVASKKLLRYLFTLVQLVHCCHTYNNLFIILVKLFYI